MDLDLLVVTSCTKSKATEPEGALQLADFRDPVRLRERSQELRRWQMPAVEMYTGQQHVHVRQGLERLRGPGSPVTVGLRIISAGYGLLAEEEPIVPYEATFITMSTSERREWSRHLQLPGKIREAVAGVPVVLFLLGGHYLKAIELPLQPRPGQRFVFFASEREEAKLAGPGVTVVPAGPTQATALGAGVAALKGRMFDLLAQTLIRHGVTYWNKLREGRDGAAVLGDLEEMAGHGPAA